MLVVQGVVDVPIQSRAVPITLSLSAMGNTREAADDRVQDALLWILEHPARLADAIGQRAGVPGVIVEVVLS